MLREIRQAQKDKHHLEGWVCRAVDQKVQSFWLHRKSKFWVWIFYFSSLVVLGIELRASCF
jgi:hypothetical protein